MQERAMTQRMRTNIKSLFSARRISLAFSVVAFLFLAISLFYLVRILTLPNYFVWLQNPGLVSSDGTAYIYIQAKLHVFQYREFLSLEKQLYFAVEGMILAAIPAMLVYPFPRLKSQPIILLAIKPVKTGTRLPSTGPLRKVAQAWPFAELGLGSLFLLAFILVLIASAAILTAGHEIIANDIAVYAFYSLVIGVILQIASFVMYGEGKEDLQT